MLTELERDPVCEDCDLPESLCECGCPGCGSVEGYCTCPSLPACNMCEAEGEDCRPGCPGPDLTRGPRETVH